jgi:hypothetical protein
MGLLDDAIREHLELKRRRGADPTEIEELEREALGPVRPVGEKSAPDDQEYEDADEPLSGEGDEFGDEVEWEDEYEPLEPEGSHADYGEPETEIVPAPAETSGAEPLPELVDEEEDSGSPAEPPAHDVGVETAEYDVEGEHAAEEAKGGKKDGEDVLEETPEFLQDTPDHDRLWFEQRPPRDFDFEG